MARIRKSKAPNCQTLTVEAAGEIMGIGRNQAYEAAHRGDLPSIKIGKRILVPKALLDKLLEGTLPASAGAKAA